MKIRFFLLFLLIMGCKKEAHPAEKEAMLILDAIQFNDQKTLINHHVESSPKATFCTDEFKRILTRMKKTQTPERCKDLNAMTLASFQSLKKEAKLLAKIAKFSCNKEGENCRTFSSQMLEESWTSTVWMKDVQSYRIQRTIADEASAVVYVEVTSKSAKTNQTLKLRKVGSRWLLESGLGSKVHTQ